MDIIDGQQIDFLDTREHPLKDFPDEFFKQKNCEY